MSPNAGPSETRARLGLSPNRPQQLAGIRIEPPPSLACATGTRPAATAAADPPLEPPVVRVGSYGLRLGGHGGGSADGRIPSSEVLVLPTRTKPARRSAATR